MHTIITLYTLTSNSSQKILQFIVHANMPHKALGRGLPWTMQHGRAGCPHLPHSEGLPGGGDVDNELQERSRQGNSQKKGGPKTTFHFYYPDSRSQYPHPIHENLYSGGQEELQHASIHKNGGFCGYEGQK